MNFVGFLYQKFRILFYILLSNKKLVLFKIILNIKQPVLLAGTGSLIIEKNTKFGFRKSPDYYSKYSYFEARGDGLISIGKNSRFNNSCNIIATESVKIGRSVLLGSNVTIFDSDFHRVDGKSEVISKPVIIGDNVFIGSNCLILKGTVIPSGSVVGAGSIVTKSFKEPSVICGNPARIIRVRKHDAIQN